MQSTFNACLQDIDHSYTSVKDNFKQLQTSILEQKEELIAKQLEWLEERESIRKINRMDVEVMKINIGGTVLQTSQSLLKSVPDSKLERMFSGELTELKKVEGVIFIDRNGKIFEAMIDYLRDERAKMPKFSELND
jgi:hypothetical protein